MHRNSRVRRRARAGALGLLLATLVAGAPALAGADLERITVASLAERTRVTLDLSARVADHVFRLANPERLVVDLDATALAAGTRVPAAAGLVAGLRLGPQPKHTLRVVLTLRAATAAKASWSVARSGRGARLTLDLRTGVGAIAPRAAAAGESPSSVAPLLAAAAGSLVPRQPAHAPGETGRDIVVAVDAGHGGDDPGAIGPGGSREKEVVLAIARALAATIDREPGMHAVLTRDGDYFIALRERIRRARAAKADLFVSIHADSVRDPEVSGASVYVLSVKGATNEAARWLAERENAADLKGGVKLDDKDNALASVLLDLSQSASLGASSEAAERVLSAIDRVGDVRKREVQQAGFVVLKSPDIPSMLVETAYISNPREERRLDDPAHQQELAAAIFSGVRQYFAVSPPDGTRFAIEKRAAGGLALAGRATP